MAKKTALIHSFPIFHCHHRPFPCRSQKLAGETRTSLEDAVKHKAILLTVRGLSPYQLIWDLLSPVKCIDKTFDKLVKTRIHQQGETINNDYVT